MLTIVTWLWKPTNSWGKPAAYGAKHVNALMNMVKHNLSIPHRFVVVTDMPSPDIKCEQIPLWEHPMASLPDNYPSCYVRLKAFGELGKQLFGDKFVSIDLDSIVLGDLTPLFAPIVSGEADFLIMKGDCCPYNGSMWGMKSLSRREVWDDFNPLTSPQESHQQVGENGRNFYGSDQAWISHKIRGERTWGEADGVYQYAKIIDDGIPDNARIVFFAGGSKPWSLDVKALYPDVAAIYDEYANM